jgi:fermentation-respiration switch protein FrsA (DUF1100 family)
MAFLKWTFILAAAVYVGFAALMYVAQRALMYFPETVRTAPAAAGFPQGEEVALDTADGEKIIVWHVPPRGDNPVVVYFHGNGGSLRLRVDRFRKLAAAGIGLVALSYRGYGGSSGNPTEAGLIADARAAYDFAAARYPGRIALWGESLGTGVAVALAAEKPVARVILESPYTSTLDVAAANYWFLPVRLLMKDQFRSDQRIAQVTAPILILHGEADGIIPIQYGERLYAMVSGEKRLVRFPRGSHNDLDDYGASDEALKFLQQPLD